MHVLVTGASRGIGLAVAQRLIHDGAHVTLAARNADTMSEFRMSLGSDAGRCHVSAIDLASAVNFDQLVADIEATGGHLDGVVHAAGVQLRKRAVEVTAQELEQILHIHLMAPYLLSTAIARRQIAANRGGSHVFIGSLGSSIAIPGASPYTAAKSGVIGVVHALAVEFAPHGIRVNAVKPGYVKTELTADLLKAEAQRARILNRTPLGRFGQPAEVAAVVAFLLGEESSYVTGEAVNVDGGWLAN